MTAKLKKWLIRAGILMAVVAILGGGIYVFRAPILRGVARVWIVNDPVARADAIVVLGGGLEYRPFEAARLYSNGVAPVILITQVELSPTQEMGLTVPEAVTARKVLIELGVPESAIQPLGTNVTSTRDEAMAVAAWARETGAQSVVIPTDIFHTRRVRWIMRKAVKQDGGQQSAVSGHDGKAAIHVVAIEPKRYQSTNWWQREDGFLGFQTEVLKSFFYGLKY